jgi:7,8-dihydropterin-6-yl-methyl-4-(beta-D-ribofuranosyl)aminobenzene 5'-phosphate synthase
MTSVTISVVYDNRNANPHLQEGWGLSLFLEFEERKILFDAGGNKEAFLANLERLQVPLNEITDVVISHKHWDHVAGLESLLARVSDNTKVYLPKFFPGWFLRRKFGSLRFVSPSSFHEIDRNIFSFSMKASFLLHEQILVLSTIQGLILFTGCAHPGIINIIRETKSRFPKKRLQVIVGGFHLYKASDEQAKDVVHAFQVNEVEKVAACHCSGERVQKQFEETYGNNFLSIGTGSLLHL